MSWYTIFYLFSLADKISASSKTLFILSTIAFGITILFKIGDVDGEWRESTRVKWRKCFWRFGLTFVLAGTLWTFIPDRSDMTLIVAGGSVGQFVMNDDNAKALPADITRFLRKEILVATGDVSDIVKKELNIPTVKDTLISKSKEELIKLLEKQIK